MSSSHSTSEQVSTSRQSSFNGASSTTTGGRLSISEQHKAVVVEVAEHVAKVYEGPKNFWRTRQSLDLVMLEYTEHNCIEINAWWETLPLNPDDVPKAESQSVYVNAAKARALVRPEDIEKRTAELEHGGKYGKASHAQHTENLTKVIYDALGLVLLAKVRMVAPPAAAGTSPSHTITTISETSNQEGNENDQGLPIDGSENQEEITETDSAPLDVAVAEVVPTRERFTLSPEDESPCDLVIDKPEGLISVSEKVRPAKKWGMNKRTSFIAEFDAVVHTFNAAVHEIDNDTKNATRLQNVAHMTMDLMQAAIKKQEERRRMNKFQRLWKWASHKIILQNTVAKLSKRLEHMTFPAVGSTRRASSHLACDGTASAPASATTAATPPAIGSPAAMGSPKPSRSESKLVLPPIMELGSEKSKTGGGRKVSAIGDSASSATARSSHPIVEAAKEARKAVSAAHGAHGAHAAAHPVAAGGSKNSSRKPSASAPVVALLPAVGGSSNIKENKKKPSLLASHSSTAEEVAAAAATATNAAPAPKNHRSASFTNKHVEKEHQAGGGGSGGGGGGNESSRHGSKTTKTRSESILKNSASAEAH